jgi:peroxiredoxin
LRELQELGVGRVAPEIVGKDADGVGFKLSDFRGRVVVLLFSGEWCVPCRAQQPKLRELQTKFREMPVCFLGVMSDPPERLREAIKRGDIGWRCWCDGDRNSAPITTRWNITSWPTIHVLDQQGIIRQRRVSVDQLEGIVRRLIEGRVETKGKRDAKAHADAPDGKVRAKDFVEPGTLEQGENGAVEPGEREAGPPMVSSRQEADRMLGKRVALVGEARSGKTPNVRVTSDLYVTCHGEFRWQGAPTKPVVGWPESTVGKKVKVIGRIEKAYLGETNSVPIIESNYGHRLWDVIYEVAKPEPAR